MSYQLNSAITDLEKPGKFVNADGRTECVEFVRQACGAPRTGAWQKGESMNATSAMLLAYGIAYAGSAAATTFDCPRTPGNTK